MKVTTQLLHGMICNELMKGLSKQKCIELLGATFCNRAPTDNIIYSCFQNFAVIKQHTSLINKGRPKSVDVSKYIDAVKIYSQEAYR